MLKINGSRDDITDNVRETYDKLKWSNAGVNQKLKLTALPRSCLSYSANH